MLGINRPDGAWDESLDTTWIERLHPEDREHAVAIFDDYLKSDSRGLYENFFRMRHENGSWVWIWSRGRRLCDTNGHLTNITLGSHIDITERIKAEEKIKQSEQLLRKITSNIPCNTYMFEIEESGRSNMLFMNRGVEMFNHNYTIDELSGDPEKIREIIHDDDKTRFNDAMKEAYRNQSSLSIQYRVIVKGCTRWRWFQAVPERNKEGKLVWYGATNDITPLVDYISSIEQILFDISHVIRRPISTMLGITKLIAETDLAANEIKDYSQSLFLTAKEMDDFIQVLNRAYNEKKENNQIQIDFSSTVDERASLFK
jgi:PAS domain-containing protein